MAETVMIVEDEDILREIEKDYFLSERFNVLEAQDGEEALALFDENNVNLIILDIMIPGVDGWSVCRRIRKKSNCPIIILTARTDEDDTLLGFELGADDYVTKPYSPPILLARAKRLLDSNRQSTPQLNENSFSINGITIHIPSRLVKINEEMIHLTHTEFEILVFLIKNKGRVITREQLITSIWGYDFAGDDRTINTHIRNLRIKLGSKSYMIKTIVRTGYKFEETI
ncbi:response regulator transcription factor [Aquibacillus sp. 3ASR75-11]|uniref:Response regulator transcription factor n=1 Tax=Terrihalobacillus insolitus TaxID=2950438 RepID=A0A9X4ALP2_9BACI|nr:response regulator transcription factor [Terrihalobacillus insolitus]MDC3424451.1 response regulator transcription factor [Terrihalobacillus insolitus]